jgi:phosphoenolpyruvate phosphomutase
MSPNVYVSLSGDFLHHGHINILKTAQKYGTVTLGLLTDRAIATKRRVPLLTYDQRLEVLSSIEGVGRVVPQEEWDYAPNIDKYRPDFFVHGDDWLLGPDLGLRQSALKALSAYGGNLIEIPHTPGVFSSALAEDAVKRNLTPDLRRATLRRQLDAKPLLRVIEAHSPMGAIIAEQAREFRGGEEVRFDALWSSSLADSTILAKPDTEAVSISDRLSRVNEMFEITGLPLIFDADTGGQVSHLELSIRSMERLGISAAIIEDKKGLKKNSLFGNSVEQNQDTLEDFSAKIEAAKSAKTTDDFMVIARIESLILEAGQSDALERANAYVEAGADGVMIHSRRSEASEVMQFAENFRRSWPKTPLVCVPSTYATVTEGELEAAGFNVVIYANHMLRAAFPAMKDVAALILRHGRSAEADPMLATIDEILSFIPGTR